MNTADIAIDLFGRTRQLIAMCIEGLTVEQLMRQPDSESNPLGWTAWHLTRTQDEEMSKLAGREQAWTAEGWHERFGLPADPDYTGTGDSMERGARVPVAGCVYPSSATTMPCTPEPRSTCVPSRLKNLIACWMNHGGIRCRQPASDSSVFIHDNSMHSGEMAYLKGMFERRQWYPA